jgi:hypothetical protein
MINLLPQEMKQDFHYGRRNSQVLRWLVTVIFGILMLLVVAAIGRLTIQTARNQTLAQKQVLEDQLKTADYDTINGEYSDFSSGLSNVKKLYQQQVLYSRLIRKLGTLLPPGAKITNISIGDKDRAVSLNFDNDAEGMGPTIQLNLTDQSKQVVNKTTQLFNENLILPVAGAPTADNESQKIRFYVSAGGDSNEAKLTSSLKTGGDLAFNAVKPALGNYLIDYNIITANGATGATKSSEELGKDLAGILLSLPQVRSYSVNTSTKAVDFTVRADNLEEARSIEPLLTDSNNSLFIETYTFEDIHYTDGERCTDPYLSKPTCSESAGKCQALAANGCQYTVRAYYDELYKSATARKASEAEKKECLKMSAVCTHLVEASFSQLFSKVDINRVAACTKDASSNISTCPVEMRAEFSNDAKFYLINPAGSSQ